MKLTVKVDDNICIGSGSCVVMAPEFFTLNEKDGKAEVRSEDGNKQRRELILEVNSDQKEKILTAAGACPVTAISVFDENGKKLFP